MAANNGIGIWGCLIWETIVKGIIFIVVVLWQCDKYGSLTKAYHHWADDSWWFAPVFWIYMIIWAGVLVFILLVGGMMIYDWIKSKFNRIMKGGDSNG